MASSFFNNLSRFTRSNKAVSPLPSPTLQQQHQASPTLEVPPSVSRPLTPPAMTASPDLSANGSASRRPPFYFREEHSTLIVKGNFMTLAAKPAHVDKGEWLAHQIVEQYRLLEGMLKVIQEIDTRTGLPTCNVHTCPQMMAANTTIYTWLDNQRNPVRIPAAQYISLVQKWILGKITDAKIFPTDTTFSSSSTYPGSSGSSTPTQPIPAGPTNLNASVGQLGRDWLGKSWGFPENFENDIRNLYRQMFRCYAHMYYAHWLEPYYHLGIFKELNTCFIHFVNVGKQFDLLVDRDLAPMQPLIDIWYSKGLLPLPQRLEQS